MTRLTAVLMRCELTLIFIVGHSSCAHRVSIRSLTRFHHDSVYSCLSSATGVRYVQAVECLPDLEKLERTHACGVRLKNTPDRGVSMHHVPAVRYLRQKLVIGNHQLRQRRCVPGFRCFLVCDSRCIVVSVCAWPLASTSVTYCSTFNSLTYLPLGLPKG